jgi:hypothetical protein
MTNANGNKPTNATAAIAVEPIPCNLRCTTLTFKP